MKHDICRKESKSKLRTAGPRLAEILSAPESMGMLLAPAAHVAGGAASQEPGLPRDSRDHLFLDELENYI